MMKLASGLTPLAIEKPETIEVFKSDASKSSSGLVTISLESLRFISAGKYKLMVPQGAALGFSERYENLLSQWLAERNEHIYVVQKGDNLSAIAERFNVPVKAIMIWNDITNGKKVLPGNKLFIFSDTLKKETNANKIENAPTKDPVVKLY